MQEENEVQQVAVPVEEKVKVQSTEEGKIFIDPMDLFSLERVREIINRVNEINVIKGSKSLTQALESLPANLLIFPLIGGYYITTRYERSKYIGQRKSTQAVLFDAVLVAIPLLAVSLGITTALTYMFPEAVFFLKEKLFPIKDEFFGTCLLSSIIAFVFVKTANAFLDETKSIFRAIEIVGNELEVLFLSSCRDSQLIQITLKSNKVYIGWVEVISKPTQNQFIRLLPLFSGYRDDKSKELEITTDYSKVYFDLLKRGKMNAIRQADVNLVINTAEILTASKFDFDYFEKFVLERKSDPVNN